MTHRVRRALPLLAPAALAAPLLSACTEDGPTLTVYNAQHEELMAEVAPLFEEQTGIEVELRSGKDLELANQLVAEGEESPADVFLTENSPAMTLVDNAGLFAPVDQSTLELIPDQYEPSSGRWTGFIARSTVLVYNTDAVSPDELPDSILDLAEPEWAGRVAFSPTGADFQAIVSAVVETQGQNRAREWLQGLADNGEELDNNLVVMEAVNAGEVDTGIIYHYYWYRDQEEAGENSDSSQLHFFGDQDPGAFVSVSGAGVLASTDNPGYAQQFVRFLASEEGQQAIADSYALEYTLTPAVELDPPVKPFSELEPPRIDVASLNSEPVVEMMQELGLL